jgi:hypothetical protein
VRIVLPGTLGGGNGIQAKRIVGELHEERCSKLRVCGNARRYAGQPDDGEQSQAGSWLRWPPRK